MIIANPSLYGRQTTLKRGVVRVRWPIFLNFGSPVIYLETVKIGTSNLMCWMLIDIHEYYSACVIDCPEVYFFYFGSQNLFNLCKITDDILETAQGTPSPVHPVTTLLSFGARWWRRCLESIIRISRKIVDRFLLKCRQTARPGTRNNWPDFGPRSSGRIVLCCIVLSPEVAGRPPVQAIYRSLFISSCCNRHFLKRSTLTCSWTAAVPGRSCV